MSENTSCNFCSLLDVKYRAKREGKRVLVTPCTSKDGLGGLDVLVFPKTVKPAEAIKHRKKYFSRWFWELSDNCVC